MIREIRMANFMSVRDEKVLSFEATKDDTARELLTVEVRPNLRLNRMVVIYGANASGKSNILYAYDTLWRMLVSPYTDRRRAIPFSPFALERENNTRLSVSFFIGDVRYDYSVEYNARHIVAEKMEYAPNGVMSLFYDRRFMDDSLAPSVFFGRTLGLYAKTKKTLVDNTLNNHTLLSTLAKVSLGEDAAPLQTVYNWIVRRVHGLDTATVLDVARYLAGGAEVKEFLLSSMRRADFNIADIAVERGTEGSGNEDVFFVHRTESGERFRLPVTEQSLGTLRYFRLQETMFNMTQGDHVYCFDELETNLHYDLLLHYLTTFMMSGGHSQILFTTQDQQLLDEEFVRRDMVWFTEKSRRDASTDLYCASEFGLHKNLSLYKAYKTGKLGAKPELGSVF